MMIAPNDLLDFCWQLTQRTETALRQSEQQQHQSQREIEQQVNLLTQRYLANLSKPNFQLLQQFSPEFAGLAHIRLAFKNAYILGIFKSPDYASTLMFVQAEFKAQQSHRLSQQLLAEARQRLALNQSLTVQFKNLQNIRQNLLNYDAKADDNEKILFQLTLQLNAIAAKLGVAPLPIRKSLDNQMIEVDESARDSPTDSTSANASAYFASQSFQTSSTQSQAWQDNDSTVEYQAFSKDAPELNCEPTSATTQPELCRHTDSSDSRTSNIRTDDSLGRFS